MEASELTKHNYIHSYPKQTVIFREGDTNNEMYFVLKGTVELSIKSENEAVIVNRIDPGGFFGEMSLIEGVKRDVTAVTTDNTILMIIDRENFNEVIQKNPQLALTVITGLCLRLRDAGGLKQANPVALPEDEAASETSTIAATLAEEPETEPETAPETGQMTLNEEKKVETSVESPSSADDQAGSFPAKASVSRKCIELTSEIYAKYCFAKDITCPVCEYKFKTDLVRESRLQVKERSEELRTVYNDIEPLFFGIWTCPECYYSMKRADFDKITDIQKKNLAHQITQRKNIGSLDFNNKHCYDFAILAHKIAIDCCDSLGKKDIEERIAGLWLNIAWLYDDLGQQNDAAEARANALAKYKNAYIFGTDRTDAQDQKIEYLIGKLSWQIGNIKEAKDHFFKIVNRRQAHQMLKQMAQEGLKQLKNL